MEDRRNFIEFMQDMAVNTVGRELSPSELAEKFERIGRDERIDHLVRIDGDLKASEFSVEKATKFHAYRRALKSVHRRLMDIDR